MTIADAFPASLSVGSLLAGVQAFLSHPAISNLIISTFTIAISGWFVTKIRQAMDAGWEKRKRQASQLKDWVKGKSGSKS